MFGRLGGLPDPTIHRMVRPMPGPVTFEEFLKLIRKSEVIDPKSLDAFMGRRTFDADAGAADLADEMVREGVLTGFQAEQLLQGKWRGFTIGRYKYLERIGVGGMGQVFLCEHIHTRRRVAVKVLPPAKAAQPAALGRFYREARAAAALQHPNAVRIHDIDQDGEHHFIAMDYIAGPNLLDVAKRFGPLDIDRATSYVCQVARALDFAFRNGIIHRLDLGLARFLNDHSDQLTLKYDDKIVLGTADYVAPEQIENSHAVDTRADIYALGATFYFLLAGHPPFPTGTVSQKLLWHRTRQPTPIQDVRANVPKGLAEVVSKMMEKDPRERYQTPAQAISALEAWLTAPVPLPRAEEMPRLSRAAMPAESRIDEGAQSTGAKPDETARGPNIADSSRLAASPESKRGSAVYGTRGDRLTQKRALAKSRSDSETEETAALMTTPSQRSTAVDQDAGCAASPAPGRPITWVWASAFAVAIIAALVWLVC
jgi:serine/threonine protein kinase